MNTCASVFRWTLFVSCICAASVVAFEKESSICTIRKFKCANGDCIPSSYVCDGEFDCSDKSDELQCGAGAKTCLDSEFRCTNGRCVLDKWRCDGEKDCNDGSDEDEKECELRECKPDEYTCRTNPRKCIPLSWECDGHADCPDGTDEKNCNQTCRAEEFTCANSKCIQKRWLCDMEDDCGDKSDELNCPPVTCREDEFFCHEKYCINAKWRCDGYKDCANGRDEKDCPISTPNILICPNATKFQCNDGLDCIDKRWMCDGKKDCADGSDESYKICHSVKCRTDQFQCADLSCIPGYQYCNGKSDCQDGSDERNCTAPEEKCDPKTHFDCGGGGCILLSQVCDRKQDCPNFEDEPKDKCNVNECADAKHGCSQTCVDTPASYYCECHPGYVLQANNRTCEDINECEIPGSCSQICINEKGTFKCDCEPGYKRENRDHTKCKATEGHASLLFAHRKDIRKISLERQEMTSIVADTNSATALDFVFRTGEIFWSDVKDQKIYSAPIDEGNKAKTVIMHDVTTSDGLAVDWIYNHIYWTDAGKNTIELANFEGQMRKVLIQDELEEPRALALSPHEGWMFWTDWGRKNPKIERAGMDGTHRETIVKYDIIWPNGLTLDLVKKQIYWVDAKLNVLSTCDYNGRNRRVVLSSPEYLKHPFSITTFEDWLYWTEWGEPAIYRANKFTGEELEPIIAKFVNNNPMAIHVYHPYRQPEGVNHCQAVNGHCSHLCLPAPQITPHSPLISCACPEYLRMLPDGLTCVQDMIESTTPSHSVNDSEITVHITTENSHVSTSSAVNKSHVDLTRIGTESEESDSGTLAVTVIAISGAVVVLLGVVGFLVYKHYMHRNMTSMNFDNPVYRKTTEDQFSLEKNAYPSQRMFPSTVGEEAQEPLTGDGNNDFV